MKDLILSLDTSTPEPIVAQPKTTSSDDALGQMLQGKWDSWAQSRRSIEMDWLKDLRAFNQQNETTDPQLSKFHNHVYTGLTRTKCTTAYARIIDLMFSKAGKHWTATPTPIPESAHDDPEQKGFAEDMEARAKLMESQMDDQTIDLHYEDYVKSCILEACVIGTGVIKGVIPDVKTIEKWEKQIDPLTMTLDWAVVKTEIPAPKMDSPSIFNVIPDPYANRVEDMTGVFERHIYNRQQFSELQDDKKFDEVKIKEILDQTDKGNHVPLYHETERRAIAGLTDALASNADRYDLLEYWGQVSGRLLITAGISNEIEETGTYWANVWTCSSRTLFARVMPMKKQRIPYNFFIYNKVPHQFYGVSPGRMMRNSQITHNGSIRSMLDGMAMAAVPMSEVNVTMLKMGQDPNKMLPGQVWLRDAGDPSVPAVRFFQPTVPTGQLMEMASMFKNYADDESALPAYTYGDQSQEINKTAQGMSMQMGAAAMPIKQVIKNLEDYCLRPFLLSLFDWNMQWSDRDDIKGDLTIEVLGSSALIAKEVKSSKLLQFLNMTNNAIDLQYVDRKYLLTETASCMEIDAAKAIPMEPPQNQTPPSQPDPVAEAKAVLLQAQAQKEGVTAEKEKAMVDKIIADTAATNIRGVYEATQASVQILANPDVIPTSDSILKSAGFKDHDSAPVATISPQIQSPMEEQQEPMDNMMEEQGEVPGVQTNTSPQFPPVPQKPEGLGPDMEHLAPSPMSGRPPSGLRGIETMKNEPV